jgi:uncharacterized protein
MKNFKIQLIGIIFFGLLLPCSSDAQRLPARMQGVATNDFANVIPASFQNQIEAICVEVWEKTNTAIVDVTIETLDDYSIEEYATRLYETWGIGKKGEDKGVLILNAIQDRKVRIETGYGVEGILPDGKTGQIIDDYMIPHLKQGDYGQAHLNAVIIIAQIIAEDAGVQLTGEINTPQGGEDHSRGSRMGKFLTFLFFIFLIIITRGRILPWLIIGSMSGGGGRGRDNWGGFGGSGGGFGGGFGGFGGGMSGGGGASRGY